MKSFRKSTFLLLLLGVFLTSPGEAEAQRWYQTAQLIVPVETESTTSALLDTLVQVIERRDSIMVRRSPESSTRISLSDLRNELISEAGIGLSSANRVFVDYKFMLGNRGYQEKILSLQFLYRPAGQGESDTQMIHIDADEPWVQEVLRNKGTSLRTNQAALKTFSDQLAFARIQDQEGAQVVEIAGQPVRTGFEEKKQQLVRKIKRLTYGGGT